MAWDIASQSTIGPGTTTGTTATDTTAGIAIMGEAAATEADTTNLWTNYP